jgi:hypothetical protein
MLKYFKRDSLQVMIDCGQLRSHKDLSIGLDLMPKLLGQAEYTLIVKRQN